MFTGWVLDPHSDANTNKLVLTRSQLEVADARNSKWAEYAGMGTY